MRRTPPRKSVVDITRYSLQTVKSRSTGFVMISFLLPRGGMSPIWSSSSDVWMRSEDRAAHGARGGSRSGPNLKFARSRPLRCRNDGEILPAGTHWIDALRRSEDRPRQWHPGLRHLYAYRQPG